MDIDLSLPAERVVRALDQVIEWRGKPRSIRSDNGPEYISSKLVLWAEKHGIRLEHIQPGNPQQNAYVERYNRTVRYDWLGHYLFESTAEVQEHATRWIWTYMGIPRALGHPFHEHLDSDSTLTWTPIPRSLGH